MIQKDFKIGLVVGAICLLGMLAWLATNKSYSTDARLAKSFEQSKNKTPSVTPALEVATLTPDPQPINAPLASETSPPPLVIPKELPVEMPVEQTTMEPKLSAPEDPATEPTGPKIKTNRFHIVKKGETLSGISQAVYGTAKLWPKIYNANRDQVDAPEKIRPSMFLIIPD